MVGTGQKFQRNFNHGEDVPITYVCYRIHGACDLALSLLEEAIRQYGLRVYLEARSRELFFRAFVGEFGYTKCLRCARSSSERNFTTQPNELVRCWAKQDRASPRLCDPTSSLSPIFAATRLIQFNITSLQLRGLLAMCRVSTLIGPVGAKYLSLLSVSLLPSVMLPPSCTGITH